MIDTHILGRLTRSSPHKKRSPNVGLPESHTQASVNCVEKISNLSVQSIGEWIAKRIQENHKAHLARKTTKRKNLLVLIYFKHNDGVYADCSNRTKARNSIKQAFGGTHFFFASSNSLISMWIRSHQSPMKIACSSFGNIKFIDENGFE